MTGSSHWFDAAVYGVICLVLLIGSAAVIAAGWPMGVFGLVGAAVFFVLSLRAAWASDAASPS